MQKTILILLFLALVSLHADTQFKAEVYNPFSKTLKHKYFKNIPPEKIIEYINNNKQEKPVFVYLSSQDKGCGYCRLLNNKVTQLAEKYHNKLDFISVDFYPWTTISHYEEILDLYQIAGVPYSMIIYKDKIISYMQGNYKKSAVEKIIKNTLKEIKQNKNLERFGNHIKTSSIYFANASKIEKKNHRQYLAFKGYKAMAMVLDTDNNKRTSSWKSKYLSQEEANNAALARCEVRKAEKNIDGTCKLYIVGNNYVYDKTDAQIKTITKNLPSIETAVDKSLKKFEVLKNHKAFALAKADDGNWRTWWGYGYKTQEKADKEALRGCDQERIKAKIKTECKIIARGGQKSQIPPKESKPKKAQSDATLNTLSAKSLAGYKISAGTLEGKDHPIYKIKYESFEFGCNKEALFESASNEYKFHNKERGKYRYDGDEIVFKDREGYSNYIVGLQDGKVVVGKSSFEDPGGLKVEQINKIKTCR